MRMGMSETGKWSADGVIITVYKECPTVRSQGHQNKMIRVLKSSRTKTPSGCYDRRAELLAYTHQLRKGVQQRVDQEPFTNAPMPKQKQRRRWSSPFRRLKVSFSRLFREKERVWRYENINCKPSQKRHKSYRRGAGKWSKVSKILRNNMKAFTSSWKRKKQN